MNRQEIVHSIKTVSNRMKSIQNDSVNEVCKIGIIDINNWEWAQGVGLYGLFRYYEYCGEQRELDWICGWIDRNLEKGLPERNINTTAPLYTVAQVYEKTGNTRYIQVCREWAKWIMDGLDRTEFGGFQHVVSDGKNHMQLWDDTLFMTVLFLAKMGVMEQNEAYLKECEHQFLLHAQYLADRKTGLWFHGWTFDGKHNFADARWARGNCWITAFVPDFLELTGIACGAREFMVDVLQAQAGALCRCQDTSGMWHTLLDDESSYVETSATAGFAYGLLKSVRLGILDKRYLEPALKAAEAVMKQIDTDGTVLQVSYGTGMGKTLQDYRDIPICPMTYGQALVIMMLAELLNHMED